MSSAVQNPALAGVIILLSIAQPQHSVAADQMFVWPNLAPGETLSDEGTAEPLREGENPPVSRITRIRRPSIDVFPTDRPNGSAVVVLPGGGFGKVVPDKEGSEAAPWLNQLGISAFVLRYRTNEVTPKSEPAWRRPLQDAQRTLRLIRHDADKWKIDRGKVGVLGFSAGGQVASILHTSEGNAAYGAIDDIDKHNYRPDFFVAGVSVADSKCNRRTVDGHPTLGNFAASVHRSYS